MKLRRVMTMVALATASTLAAALGVLGPGATAGGGARAASIQDGWFVNPANGHSYRLTTHMTWPDAEAAAVALGGHLVTVNDGAEEAWVRQTFGTGEHFWIGFNDIQAEAVWVWSSGEPVTYTNWCVGEPNNFNNEDAAAINWSHTPGQFGDCWNDLPISGGLRGVVELAGDPPSPPPAPPEPDAFLGADQNTPPCLNPYRASCAVTSTWWVAGAALAGAFRIAPDSSYEPDLVDQVVVQEPDSAGLPFALTYELKDAATWNDGTPVTAHDFVFTYESLVDPANDVDAGTRGVYGFIERAIVIDEKTVRFEFEEAYAPWRDLFPWVLPKHVLAGHDFDTIWRDAIDDPATGESIGSGTFLVTHFDGATTFTLSRNDAWWGGKSPAVGVVAFRFYGLGGAHSLIDAFEAGELDAIYASGFGPASVRSELAALRSDPSVAVESNPGPGIEHLELNLAAADMPLLAQPWFRQAIAYGLDRDGLVAKLFGGMAPGMTAAQSLIYSPLQAEYEPHFARYSHDIVKVATLMIGNGCVLGLDAIWSCGGVRASVKFATTSGNPTRVEAQDGLIANAKEAGIELVKDNSPAGILFGTRLPTGAYQMSMFTWLRATGDPAGSTRIYSCGGELNFTSYCSQEVTQLLAAADVELDPARRASLVNETEAIIANDVPGIPLYWRPTFLAYHETVEGPRDNPVLIEGPLWNVDEWEVEEAK